MMTVQESHRGIERDGLSVRRLATRHQNLVENVGYGNERIHTGFLIWVLNWNRNSDMAGRAFARLWHSAEPVGTNESIESGQIATLETHPQRKRGMAIDLEVEAVLTNGEKAYLGIDFKVDAEETRKQFSVMRKSYMELAHRGSPCRLLIVALGASEFKLRQGAAGWSLLGLRATKDFAVEMVRGMPRHERAVWGIWISALDLELCRRNASVGLVLDAHRKARRKDLGYRSWGLYSSAYGALLPSLQERLGGLWAIYERRGNAVLRWVDGEIRLPRARFSLYWEFNNRDFSLKMRICDDGDAMNGSYRAWIARFRSIAERQGLTHLPSLPSAETTRARAGQHPTIFYWRDLLGEPRETVRAVRKIVKRFAGAIAEAQRSGRPQTHGNAD